MSPSLEGTRRIHRDDITERKLAEEQNRRLHDTREHRVAERTEQFATVFLQQP